jgi:hypothetical protein
VAETRSRAPSAAGEAVRSAPCTGTCGAVDGGLSVAGAVAAAIDAAASLEMRGEGDAASGAGPIDAA